MKSQVGECPVCNRNYTQENCRTRHHILPKRFFKGRGGLYTLCRLCHNELEYMIPLSKILPEEMYSQILYNFIKKTQRRIHAKVA